MIFRRCQSAGQNPSRCPSSRTEQGLPLGSAHVCFLLHQKPSNHLHAAIIGERSWSKIDVDIQALDGSRLSTSAIETIRLRMGYAGWNNRLYRPLSKDKKLLAQQIASEV